jgi:Phage capsid family
VFADAQSKMQLPPGTMSINIPKVNNGTSVAAQGTQNTNVSDTDLQTEYVTFPVITAAGAQVLSLQLLERSPIAFDDVVMKDLALAQAAFVDQQCLNGTGANGQVTGVYNTGGINLVTWTQSAPTIKGLYGQMAYAKSLIANQRFLPATHIFMSPTRWEWIEQQVDGNNRPLVLPAQNGPWNVMQVAPEMATAEGLTGGRMLSCAVEQDYNIPQTVESDQDLVFVLKCDDNYLYESPLISRALPQTYGAQLSILLQLYGYIAYTAARYPVSNTVITGTGLDNQLANFWNS